MWVVRPTYQPIYVASTPLREALGLDDFQTARNSGRQTPIGRFFARLLAPLMLRLLPRIARRRDE